jgi:cytochrome c biogenesis protein CcmG, thiol:disulfide interchange protein DsbE
MRRDDHTQHRFRSLASALVMTLALPVAAHAAEPPAPVDLVDLSGQPFSLESLHGKVVLLDFWAPWCVPCRASFPFLDNLQQKHDSEGFRVVGLTLEADLSAVSAFLADVPVQFPIVHDPSEKSGGSFAVVAMPTALLLDRQGMVVARFEGGGDAVHRKIEQAVVTLLAGGVLPGDAGVRVSASLAETGAIKAWRRGFLADPLMNLDGDPLTRLLKEHVHSSKEGAAGDGGPAGGGCGCN